MIEFDFDWSDLTSVLSLAAVVAILPIQLWFLIFKNTKAGGTGSSRLKIVLNLLFWVSLLAFVLQPSVSRSVKSLTGIVAGKDVPAAAVRQLQDSLPGAQLLSTKELDNMSVDTLLLFGQAFSPSMFAQLQQVDQPVTDWVPFFEKGQIQQLDWKAIVREGEMQVVRGVIDVESKQTLRVAFGGNTLDSVMLSPGQPAFTLRFPAFARGRTAVTLDLNGRVLDTLRFFARASLRPAVRFLLNSPDFESRTLADWLGKNGYSVTYDALISKDLRSSVQINAAGAPDIIITDAGHSSNAAVKKAAADGKSILFMGLTNPASEVPAINNALKTHLQVRKVTNESAVQVSPGLTALPYHFVASEQYLLLPGYPVAFERTSANVAVSLLNETFPLQLSGDSIAYQKVWNAVFSRLQPLADNNLEINAPVFAGVRTAIFLNNFKNPTRMLQIGSDTVFTNKSALNEKSAVATFMPEKAGWVAIKDSLPAEIYIENTSQLANAARVRDFVDSYQHQLTRIQPGKASEKTSHRRLPDWLWFGWLLLCLAALWIEDKFS